jgi:hypothetical protein
MLSRRPISSKLNLIYRYIQTRVGDETEEFEEDVSFPVPSEITYYDVENDGVMSVYHPVVEDCFRRYLSTFDRCICDLCGYDYHLVSAFITDPLELKSRLLETWTDRETDEFTSLKNSDFYPLLYCPR